MGTSAPKDQKLTTRQVENLRAKAAGYAGVALRQLGRAVAGEVRLTGVQVQAARVLLAKCLPDLSSVDVQHSGSGGVQINIVRLSEKPVETYNVVTLDRDTGEGANGAQRGLQGPARALVGGEPGENPQGEPGENG